MLEVRLALVSVVPELSLSELMRVSAAIQKQIVRDVTPIWEVPATIDPFASIEDVPIGYWKIFVVPDVPGESIGVHDWSRSEPMGWVEYGPTWSLAASHEALEMIVDPYGQRLTASNAPVAPHDRVEFLVEICDPSGDPQHGYTVDGELMSDFYTPGYFDPVGSSGVRYSFTGALTEPRQILKNGYLAWRAPVSGRWFRYHWFDAAPALEDFGLVPPAAASVRGYLDRESRKRRNLSRAKVKGTEGHRLRGAALSVGDALRSVETASRRRAAVLREAIKETRTPERREE